MAVYNKPLGSVILLFSSASGVGRTTLALNLADIIKRWGMRAIAVDLDVQFGDICKFIKVEPGKTLFEYQEQLENGGADISEYVLSGSGMPDVLAAPDTIPQALAIREKTVQVMLEQLKKEYDYIFVDTPVGFTEELLPALRLAEEIFFVSVIDFVPTIKNITLAYEQLKRLGVEEKKIRLILNREQSKSAITIENVEEIIQRPFYHSLPNDFKTSNIAVKKGLPITASAPDTELAKQLEALARKLTGQEPAEESHVHKLFSFFKSGQRGEKS